MKADKNEIWESDEKLRLVTVFEGKEYGLGQRTDNDDKMQHLIFFISVLLLQYNKLTMLINILLPHSKYNLYKPIPHNS